jgi:hypothetical protein
MRVFRERQGWFLRGSVVKEVWKLGILKLVSVGFVGPSKFWGEIFVSTHLDSTEFYTKKCVLTNIPRLSSRQAKTISGWSNR